jgi:hypothetical protein
MGSIHYDGHAEKRFVLAALTAKDGISTLVVTPRSSVLSHLLETSSVFFGRTQYAKNICSALYPRVIDNARAHAIFTQCRRIRPQALENRFGDSIIPASRNKLLRAVGDLCDRRHSIQRWYISPSSLRRPNPQCCFMETIAVVTHLLSRAQLHTAQLRS